MPDQAPPPFPAEKASATHAASSGVKLHEGYIDFYGYHPPSGGWYFVGWVRLPSLPPRHTDLSLTATFQLGPIAGTPTSIFHVRADLQGTGFGIVFFLPGTGRFQGPLTAIEYAADSFKVRRASFSPSSPPACLRDHCAVGLWDGRRPENEERALSAPNKEQPEGRKRGLREALCRRAVTTPQVRGFCNRPQRPTGSARRPKPAPSSAKTRDSG